MRGLTRDSVAEMFDRKTFYLYIVITILAIAFFVVMGSLNIKIDSGSGPGSPDRIAEQAQKTVDDMLNGAFSFYVTFLIFLTVLAMAALFPRRLPASSTSCSSRSASMMAPTGLDASLAGPHQ